MEHTFQINLRGIIDLLSEHLYSGPQVFVRELLQNAVDAIHARSLLEPGLMGEIVLEVSAGRKAAPTLAVIDNGVGLTEEEVHQFLATIGQSSKRREFSERPMDFIGQFGIGLLSAFVVADDVIVITQSVKPGAAALEWRGRADGKYTVRQLKTEHQPGTRVYLTAKEEHAELFRPERVAELADHFGGLLPCPIYLVAGKQRRQLNATPPPWRRRFGSAARQRQALLDFGSAVFGETFFDCIPLSSAIGGVDGVAFVLPCSPSLASKRQHRVYLKNMLLSEQAENLLPDWAFFVKCVVNANDLRPTASRESFYEDDKLERARVALGCCLRDYLVKLASSEPERLEAFIELHFLSIQALAVADDEFFQIVVDWLPVETTLGHMTIGVCRQRQRQLRYVRTVEEFRQIAPVAAAQALCIINGGYTYAVSLLEKLPEVFPELHVEAIEPGQVSESLAELTLEEREEVFAFVQLAERVLQPYHCAAEIKRFAPATLPALYSMNQKAGLRRAVDCSKDVADPVWASILDSCSGPETRQARAQLCFNYANPLVRRLATVTRRDLQARMIQMIYVQSLLLGHYALTARELDLLSQSVLDLMELALKAAPASSASLDDSQRGH